MSSRFRVKTQMQEFEAPSVSQLKLLVRMGIIRGEDQIKDLPDGAWCTAREHPILTEHFAGPSPASNTPRPRHVKATVRRQGSEPKPKPAPPPERSASGHAVKAHPPLDGTCLWVQSDDDTLEVRGLEVFERLLELGVVQRHHRVSLNEQGPFEPVTDHPSLTRLFTQPRPEPEPSEDEPSREVSNVIMLTESEIIYLNDGLEGERRREVSNVIMLSEADLEIVDEDDAAGEDFGTLVSGEQHSEELIIILEEDDILEPAPLLPPPTPRSPTSDSPWEQFRVTMHRVAQAHPMQESRELTWDVFRSIMERKPQGEVPRGPSERTWQRFRARIIGRRRERTPPRPENTWDRFRSMMAVPGGRTENTWRRFVSSIEQPAFQLGQAMSGEAPIRSGIHAPVVEPSGPSVQLNGLNEE